MLIELNLYQLNFQMSIPPKLELTLEKLAVQEVKELLSSLNSAMMICVCYFLKDRQIEDLLKRESFDLKLFIYLN